MVFIMNKISGYVKFDYIENKHKATKMASVLLAVQQKPRLIAGV